MFTDRKPRHARSLLYPVYDPGRWIEVVVSSLLTVPGQEFVESDTGYYYRKESTVVVNAGLPLEVVHIRLAIGTHYDAVYFVL